MARIEHSPTVALFEIRLQARYAVYRECSPGGGILRTSLQETALNFRVAALVVEQDTIPKPHGLASSEQYAHIELRPNTFELHSAMIESHPTTFECFTLWPVSL
jgi:hypothetical protein